MSFKRGDGFSSGFEDIAVEILESPERPFETFWNWYRQTWISLQNIPYNAVDPQHIKACIDVTERRALPTPMEALQFQVKITGLSRVALAQITRGRVGWAYNVESQMPQHIEHRVTIPLNIARDIEFGERARELALLSQELYDDMYDAGIPPQDCRYMTIHGQQTSMVCLVNFAALTGYFARRCENGLTDELNLVGRHIRALLIDKHLNSDGTDRIEGSGWSFLLGKLEAMGGDQKCLNGDEVFGNTGRAPSAGHWVPSWTNDKKKSDYDFSKSAWYFELLQLPDNLLFKGEREMIEDFKTIGFEGRLRKLGS
jgi:hypothetical protein